MGTRINLLLDHDLADFRNPAEVLARLSPTIRAAEAVRDYWLASDPDSPQESKRAKRAKRANGVRPSFNFIRHSVKKSKWGQT
jgi:hypothetical protein